MAFVNSEWVNIKQITVHPCYTAAIWNKLYFHNKRGWELVVFRSLVDYMNFNDKIDYNFSKSIIRNISREKFKYILHIFCVFFLFLLKTWTFKFDGDRLVMGSIMRAHYTHKIRKHNYLCILIYQS